MVALDFLDLCIDISGNSIRGDNLMTNKIKGMKIIPDFLNFCEEMQFERIIDSHEWFGNGKPLFGLNAQLNRRFQMYGHLFCFADRAVKQMIEIPGDINRIVLKMKKYDTCKTEKMDSIMINEYVDGQGIMPHKDAPLFGDVVLILSLLSESVLEMSNGDEKHLFTIPRRSLLVLEDDARFKYKHAILKDKGCVFKCPDNEWEVVEREPRRLAVILRDIVQNEL